MATKNDNTVFITVAGTTYYLSGTGAIYTGSGTPWTVEATSPYQLALTGANPPYIPTVAESLILAAPDAAARGGIAYGAPYPAAFVEAVGLNLRANSMDNAVFLLRQLRQILNYASLASPAILGIQGGTNTAYYNVYGASVAEAPDYIVEGISTSVLIRVTIRWVRSPLGGRLTTPETLLNAVSFQNRGTGTPDDIAPFSAGAGELINEGSPMNYTVTATNAGLGDPIRSVFLASISSLTYNTPTTTTWNTSNTTFDGGTQATLTTSLDIAGLVNNRRLKLRILIRTSANTGNWEYRVKIATGGAFNLGVIYSPPLAAFKLIDSGRLPIVLDPWRNLNDTTVRVILQIRSTDGAATTGTIDSWEAILYYDACEVLVPTGVNAQWGTGAGTNYALQLSSFAERSGLPLLPLPAPVGVVTNPGASDTIMDYGQVRGIVPRYYAGASLYVQLREASSAANAQIGKTTAAVGRTFTVTATHAPMYRSLRGGG